MCTCNHSTQCTEDYHTAQSEIDPSSAFGPSWRTAPNETPPKSLSGVCAADCSAPTTPKSRIGIPLSTPSAPPRMPRDPRLRSGLAVARRIDFTASSTPEWEDSVDELGLYSMQPVASSSYRCPETPDRPPPPPAGGTYNLKRHRPTPSPQSSRLPPRMTKMTPCGKCLRAAEQSDAVCMTVFSTKVPGDPGSQKYEFSAHTQIPDRAQHVLSSLVLPVLKATLPS